jgi:NAD(P)-dependent dehydrogenase (short-subunit alcohol dehydrogenase family)
VNSNGSVVLVTGGSTGFGRLTAETLARQGHSVFASMRNVGVGGRNASHAVEFKDLAERDGLALEVVEIDTGDEGSVKRGVAEVARKAGRIDVLVNNVGQGSWGLVEAFTTEQQKDLFETNFFSAYRMNRAVAPLMRERGSGLIVQVSSLIGRLVLPFMVTYSTAKHAVEALAEGYHYELAPLGIDSVIVEPQSHPTQGSLHKIMKPADAERLEAYGELAGRSNAMFEDNDRMLTGEGAPDPRDVADAVARLIATPAGERPLRTTVGGPMTQLVRPINRATEGAQAQLLQFMGLEELSQVTRREG